MDTKLRARMLREAWFDRDLSWLEFNRRVLAEANDERVPLLERLKFLAIFTSNLDEFFMKRVGAMRTRAYASGNLAVVEEFNAHSSRDRRDALHPMLAAAGRMLRGPAPAAGAARHHARHLGRAAPGRSAAKRTILRAPRFAGADAAEPQPVAPVPVHVEPVDVLGLRARRTRDARSRPGARQGAVTAAAVAASAPTSRPGSAASSRCRNWCSAKPQLFPGVEIEGTRCSASRATPTSQIEEDSDNSIGVVEEEVRQRRFQPVVRLEFGEAPSTEIRDSLARRSFDLRDERRVRAAGHARLHRPVRDRRAAGQPSCATRRGPRTPPLGIDADDRHLLARSAPATCSCTIRTRASTPPSSVSSATPPTTRHDRRSR